MVNGEYHSHKCVEQEKNDQTKFEFSVVRSVYFINKIHKKQHQINSPSNIAMKLMNASGKDVTKYFYCILRFWIKKKGDRLKGFNTLVFFKNF